MSLTSKGCIQIKATASGTPTEFKPQTLKQSFNSLATEDSGRTDDGVMHITYILSKIRKLEIEMPPCTPQEACSLLSLVQGKMYYITYWDILSNSEKTIYAYTSESSGECYSGVLNSGTGLYQGVSFNAIEVSGES